MYGVELYAAVRLAVVDEGLSHHEAGRRFGIDRRTVKKMLSYSAPPGYRRTKPVRRPKLDGFTGIVDAILEADTDPDVPRKQRHTAHRIFERLRDEHGFTGGYTIVKDYVRARRQSTREAFVCQSAFNILLIHEAQQGCRDATYEPSRFPVAVPYPSPHRATPAYVVVTSSDLDTSRNKASVSGLSWISRFNIDPQSACKIDPPERHGGGCPGSQ